MKILTRIILLGLLLSLSGCFVHPGYIAGHSFSGSYGVSVNSYTPYRRSPVYHDYGHDYYVHDTYVRKPYKRHYDKHHYDYDKHHYSHNKHSKHRGNKHSRGNNHSRHNKHSRGHSNRSW